MFDSMPEQSSSTEPKATTPSVDLFGAGTGVDSHTSIERLVSSLLVSPFFFLICFFFAHSVLVCPHSGMWTCACLHPQKHDSVLFTGFCTLLISLLLHFILHFLFLLWLGLEDLPAVSRGPSPLPEASVTGDLLSGEYLRLVSLNLAGKVMQV